MLRSNYENELKELNDYIIEMGSLVVRAVTDAITALETHDLELCTEVIQRDKEINEIENDIVSKCLWLITREQPIGSDLRAIATALKVVTDMERIGDHAGNICEWVEFSKTGTHKNTKIF